MVLFEEYINNKKEDLGYYCAMLLTRAHEQPDITQHIIDNFSTHFLDQRHQ